MKPHSKIALATGLLLALAMVPTAGMAADPGNLGMVLTADQDGDLEVFVMNADGTGLTQLTFNDAQEIWLDVSSNGKKIVFDSHRDNPDPYCRQVLIDPACNSEIYVMNADGSSQTNLTQSPDWDKAPDLSPNGRKIVFHSNRGDPGNTEIFVMNADGSGVEPLTDTPETEIFPRWSPNGRKIVFVRVEGSGNEEIYVMNADGSGQTRLTDNPASDRYAEWSNNGKQIAFGSDRHGNFDIFVMNADGSGQTRLTDSPASDAVPRWLPNGREIAFRSAWDDDSDIYVINADGSDLRQVTDGVHVASFEWIHRSP